MGSYTDKLVSYFLDPSHAGEMVHPDGVGRTGDTGCGDLLEVSIRVQDERLADIRYLVFGCPAAIATCEAVADMATGKTLAEASRMTESAVVEFLGGMPDAKLHCSNSATEALHRAIADYRGRQGDGMSDTKTSKEDDHATR